MQMEVRNLDPNPPEDAMRTLTLTTLILGFTLTTALAATPTDSPRHPAPVGDYLVIQTALAADRFEGVTAAATRIAADETTPVAVSEAAGLLAAATDLDAARAAFATLSDAAIAARPAGADDGLRVAFCPMAGHAWLQAGEKVSAR